jgi:hypothetical protein
MPDSKLRELAIQALTNFNAKKPSRLAKTKDTVALVSSLLALPTALISVIGLLQQTQRANVAQQQTNTVQMAATAGLQTAQSQVNGLLGDLKTVPPQGDTGAINNAITRANAISEALTNTQSQILTAAVEPSIAQPSQEWQVVIGDYADMNEARQKQDAAQKVGYSNSEIYGQPPHLHMRFHFSTKSDAKVAADKLKAARVSHEPEVVPYRLKK